MIATKTFPKTAKQKKYLWFCNVEIILFGFNGMCENSKCFIICFYDVILAIYEDNSIYTENLNFFLNYYTK